MSVAWSSHRSRHGVLPLLGAGSGVRSRMVALGRVQLWGRVQPQLFRECLPMDCVDGQGVCRGPEPVQCAHQQQGRPVAQRLLGDELAQLVRRLPGAAQREEHLRAFLAGGDVRLLQTESLALGDCRRPALTRPGRATVPAPRRTPPADVRPRGPAPAPAPR